MPEYLVGFSYHDPETYALWQRGIVEDFESNTCLWVTADTPAQAVDWGKRVAEALHRKVNRDPNADWAAADHDCWIEDSPATSNWKHCLEFFQRVRFGQMAQLDQMGSDAYVRWEKQNSA